MDWHDWHDWHAAYGDPNSALNQRLRAVQGQIRAGLDRSPAGPVKVISICAGQGHDLIGALAGHPRRGDVTARLVEMDPRNARAAAQAISAAGLSQLEVVTGDAALTGHYQGLAPAQIVLACGLFGNISGPDAERTIAAMPQLCAAGGTVIWTRHRRPPDQVPQVCAWFEERGFERLWVSDPGEGYGAGAHRFTGIPEPLIPGERLFTFVGYDQLR
jgi:hypothetical protein